MRKYRECCDCATKDSAFLYEAQPEDWSCLHMLTSKELIAGADHAVRRVWRRSIYIAPFDQIGTITLGNTLTPDRSSMPLTRSIGSASALTRTMKTVVA